MVFSSLIKLSEGAVSLAKKTTPSPKNHGIDENESFRLTKRIFVCDRRKSLVSMSRMHSISPIYTFIATALFLCSSSVVDASASVERETNAIVLEESMFWDRFFQDGVSMSVPTAAPTGPLDFGPNVIIFDSSTPVSEIQSTFDEIYQRQRDDEMGSNRYSLYFKPGSYGSEEEPLQLLVGYYTEVAGLGSNPNDVQINGKLQVLNRCFDEDGNPTEDRGARCIALNNFWRTLSNLSINIIPGADEDGCLQSANFWAVSQAASIRRVDVRGGTFSLMDYCSNPAFASGGFMADSRADGEVINGSQQQWLTRNTVLNGAWSNAVWNQMFMGVTGAPDDSTYPDPPYTTIDTVPLSREKPFLFVDDQDQYFVQLPSLQRESSGISWDNGALTPGTTLSINDFFVVNPTVSVQAINRQLSRGKHLLFTPGLYSIDESILVENANTVVLGIGHATLTAVNGAIPMLVSDQPGIVIAGITIDGGSEESPVLLQVGQLGDADNSDPENPLTLSDVYFRIGGPYIGQADINMEINSNNVLIDHVWVWRADHGVEDFDLQDGVLGDNERWLTNIGRKGVVVNGDDVTALGLFVEHYQEHNVIWNGQGGRVYFFQNELPYDPPSQAEWTTPDGTLGWAAMKVNDDVVTYELWSGGVYCFNRNDPDIVTENGFEVPETPGVKLNRILTKNLSGPGTILAVVNGVGDTVDGIPPEGSEAEPPAYVIAFPEGSRQGL